MPPTDYHGSYIGRSIMSLRRDSATHAAEAHEATGLELELDAFQRQVADLFTKLSSTGADELLSLSWIRHLLDAFLSCQEEFRAILSNNRALVGKSPVDKLIADFNDRSVKALDVCNAIRDGIEQIRQWQKLLEIVLCALDNKRNIGEGQFRRAKKALIDLAIAMIDEKDSGPSTVAYRNRSFSRSSHSSSGKSCHFRSLSWSVSRSWSAARQIQAIGNNLYPPKGAEIVATNGLAVAAYTMNSVMLFVMWALVAAIPCQDRGIQLHFSIPRQFAWSSSLLGLHDKIVEESKKKKNACGLLKEISVIEKSGTAIIEALDSVVEFPIDEEKDGEVRKKVEELRHVFEDVKEGLEPLERQVREVFHRIVRGRTEGSSDCSV